MSTFPQPFLAQQGVDCGDGQCLLNEPAPLRGTPQARQRLQNLGWESGQVNSSSASIPNLYDFRQITGFLWISSLICKISTAQNIETRKKSQKLMGEIMSKQQEDTSPLSLSLSLLAPPVEESSDFTSSLKPSMPIQRDLVLTVFTLLLFTQSSFFPLYCKFFERDGGGENKCIFYLYISRA